MLKGFLNNLGEYKYLENSISEMLKKGLNKLYIKIKRNIKIGKKRRNKMLIKIRAIKKEIEINLKLQYQLVWHY